MATVTYYPVGDIIITSRYVQGCGSFVCPHPYPGTYQDGFNTSHVKYEVPKSPRSIHYFGSGSGGCGVIPICTSFEVCRDCGECVLCGHYAAEHIPGFGSAFGYDSLLHKSSGSVGVVHRVTCDGGVDIDVGEVTVEGVKLF